MKKKIVSIFVSMLMLCVTVSAVTGTANIDVDNEVVKELEWINLNEVTENSLCTRDVEWVHYDDGTCENALGLTAGGVMHEVIKLTPDELGDYDNHWFTQVKVMHGWPDGSPQGEHDYDVWMYTGTNHPDDPMEEATIVASGTSPAENDWVEIDIDNYAFDPDDTIWIGVAWDHGAGSFPAGMDESGYLPDKSGWLYSEVTGWTQLHLNGFYSHWNLWGGVEEANQPPNTPNAPNGPDEGVTGVEFSFTASTTDPEGEQIYYMFDWDDGTYSEWLGPYNSGATGEGTHSWNDAGDFDVKVKAKDVNGGESDWSPSHTITIIEGPMLEIGVIKGGLFKVSALISNTGSMDATDVEWSITLEGGAFIGKETTGTETITAGGEVTVSSKLIIGLGATTVTVTAEVPDGISDTRTQSGFVFLFFIKVNPGGSI